MECFQCNHQNNSQAKFCVACGKPLQLTPQQKAIVAQIEGCLECGNCEVVCMVDAIKFHVPHGGTGIVYTCG